MKPEATEQLRAYIEYLHDVGVYDLYRRGNAPAEVAEQIAALLASAQPVLSAQVEQAPVAAARQNAISQAKPAGLSPFAAAQQRIASHLSPSSQADTAKPPVPAAPVVASLESSAPPPHLSAPAMPLISLNERIPLPQSHCAATEKLSALQAIRNTIGDCTRCPLAYAGRRNIVFADGDPNAKLMFVGEGPGADEDASGTPFVGKAGQLLNNMIGAMGLRREEVYIANVVKCRPPGNRTPEPVEANTCSQFLAEQIDAVQPEYIVALGATAAMYLLGVKKTLAALRGPWHEARGAKVAVTYHPAFLLRDPNMKGEAWKDLQRVMAAIGLKSPARK